MCTFCLDITFQFHDLYEMVRLSSVEKGLILEQEKYIKGNMLKNKGDSFDSSKTEDKDETDSSCCSPVLLKMDDNSIISDNLPKTTEDLPVIEFLEVGKLGTVGLKAGCFSNLQLYEPTTVTPPPTPIEIARIMEHPDAMNANAQPCIQRPHDNMVEFNRRILKTMPIMSCELCPTVFESYAQVNRHYREKHQVAGFLRCCGKKYFGASRLKYHIQLHEGQESQNKNCCPFCVYRSSSEQAMLNHLHRSHRTFGDFKDYTCNICNKV